MLMFPLEFVPIERYPGYVWNVKERRLYTYKLGSLRPLPIRYPNPWSRMTVPYYVISHLGRKRNLELSELQKLSPGYEVCAVPTLGPKQGVLFD